MTCEFDPSDPDKWWRPQRTGWTSALWVLDTFPWVAHVPGALVWLSLLT
jgi:hypothetical protein